MMTDKVSIIIPLFNRDSLILETLKSLFNQSYDNWEVIVVDDQSTDRSFEVVAQEAKKDSRIKLIKRDSEPKGAPRCRNIGIEKATGTYIIFLDSDDLLAPYCLQERLQHFQNAKENDFIVFNSSFFTDNMGDTPILWNTFSDENDLNRFLRGDNVWCISSPIWKRDAILKNELQFIESAKSSQDWEFHIKALYKNMLYEKIDGIPDFFVRRNREQSANAISSSHGSFDKLLNRIQLYKKLTTDFSFAESQCNLLFDTINGEVFNSYDKLSLNQLKTLWRYIRTIECLNKAKVIRYAYWYYLIGISSKLTFNKSHQLVYYFKRYNSRGLKNNGYRSTMSESLFKMLKDKLTNQISTEIEIL